MMRSNDQQPGFGARAPAMSQRLMEAVVASLAIAVASLGVVLLLSLYGAPAGVRLAGKAQPAMAALPIVSPS